MPNEHDKNQQALRSLLEHDIMKKFDPESILIALCLFNLAEMTQVLKRRRGEQGDGQESASGGDPATPSAQTQGAWGPLMNLMTAGSAPGGAGNPQPAINPIQLMSMLGPLLGLGAVGSGTKPQPSSTGPVQREINLDSNGKNTPKVAEQSRENTPPRERPRGPKPGEVLKWEWQGK